MARQYNVTSTINTDCVKFLAFNAEGITKDTLRINYNADERLSTKTACITFKKETSDEDVLKGIRNKVDSTAVAILDRYTISALYGMTDEDFYKISWTLAETDSRRDLITRTLKACSARIQYIDLAEPAKGIQLMTVIMGTGFEKLSTEKQMTEIRKTVDTDTVKALSVVSTMAQEELRGTTKDKFMKKAVELDPLTRSPFKAEEQQEG